MNTKKQLFAGLVVGAALLVGCEQRPEARPAPDRSGTSTSPSSPSTTRPTTPSSPSSGNTGAGSNTSPSGSSSGASSDMQSRAQTLIQQAQQQVDSGQYQVAEQTLKQLEPMRANLPRSMQQQIDQLQATVRQHQGQTSPPSTSEPSPSPSTTPPSGG